MDCGSTVPLALMKSREIESVTDISLTHPHSDHIGGLEAFAFMMYFGFKRRAENRPKLHLPSSEFGSRLWNESLKGGMGRIQDDQSNPLEAELETYFELSISRTINIDGFPEIEYVPTPHVPLMENYGIRFGSMLHYSGDTVEVPVSEAAMILQDCQFFETSSDVHVSYRRLSEKLSQEMKAKTWLVHLGGGFEKIDPVADGFAGFVMPGQSFEL